MRASPVRAVLFVLLLASALLPALTPAVAQKPGVSNATPFPAVWFNAAPESQDFLDLFRRPELWAQARRQIQVLHFGPRQMDGGRALVANNLSDIVAADAFRKLRAWGIQTAIGAPAVKEWDCTGATEEAYTVREILNVAKAGGTVDWITMDEPLVAGTGINKKSTCRISMDETAAEVATYVRHILADPQVLAAGPAPRFVDVEPYPGVDLALLQQWTKTLQAHGFRPAGLFLDVNIRFAELHPELYARMAGDLRTLSSFLHAGHIAFGVIFWSGWDPLGSDAAYYQRVIDWVKFVHQAIGQADAAVFSSWVTRCDGRNAGGDFACSRTNLGCSPSDKYCGQKSVPINLPDNDPKIFSHTRLIIQSLGILRGP
jgi:hypothetical protein